MSFSDRLLKWFEQNKRQLPWRNNKDPYKRWISEIILQQTRVQQGIKYYFNFIENFPTILDLANAEESDVMKCWEGLGYYSRARNLHKTAKHIVHLGNGQFPNNFKELLKLPGIGPYTASAIASICFMEVQPTIDGNVYRFLSRYFGIEEAIDSSSSYKIFHSCAQSLIHPERPGDFNEAMMEFGAMVCTATNPSCTECPFNIDCIARNQNEIYKFPVKTKKVKKTKRSFYFIFFEYNGNILLQKRVEKDIWFQLYQFPKIEVIEGETTKEALEKMGFTNFKNGKINLVSKEKHQLTHQELTIYIYENCSKQLYDYFLEKTNIFEIGIMEAIDKFTFPKPLKNFITKYYGNQQSNFNR